MDFVKNYVDPFEYKNCILVNKEWNTIFKKVNHVTELYHKLNKEEWFSTFTHGLLKDHLLTTLELLKCFIDTLEIPKKPHNKLKYKYKLFHYFNIKSNPRLKFINLDGM